ncbi:MAG TPA: hypothetical protein VJB08_00645 [Candidatus Nanoarchaeia archaeon]|nr:hypothetical protein [Candidatus Nanoarchaeia archaeon]
MHLNGIETKVYNHARDILQWDFRLELSFLEQERLQECVVYTVRDAKKIKSLFSPQRFIPDEEAVMRFLEYHYGVVYDLRQVMGIIKNGSDYTDEDFCEFLRFEQERLHRL